MYFSTKSIDLPFYLHVKNILFLHPGKREGTPDEFPVFRFNCKKSFFISRKLMALDRR